MKSIIITTILSVIFLSTSAQNISLKITGSHVNIANNGSTVIVLNNTKFINNSTFHPGSGEVVITGNTTDANSTISGTSPTTFYDLTINKNANNVLLKNEVNVSNQLTLTNGNLDISNYNLTIENSGTISGGSSNSFIKTSDLGVLTQKVSGSNIIFPIGNQSYTPVFLSNNGTSDDFNVRVENTVYQNGTSGNIMTTDVVNATWYIDEATPNGSDVTATFQWNASDELTDFDRTQAFISNYDNGQWNNGTASVALGSNPYTLTQSGITQFSPVIVASDANILPVELLYFYAEKEGNNVRLDWQTATEINNSHFDVEWSKDGINFEKIGEVAGAGTTNEVQFYDFLDNPNLRGLEDLLGLNYYRLKQVDLPDGQAGFDEKYEYTNTIQITIEQSNHSTINIYPNPASHYLKIESEDLVGEMVQIFSANGQLVKEFTHQSLITNLPITELPNGTYFVKMGKQVKKLIITK